MKRKKREGWIREGGRDSVGGRWKQRGDLEKRIDEGEKHYRCRHLSQYRTR